MTAFAGLLILGAVLSVGGNFGRSRDDAPEWLDHVALVGALLVLGVGAWLLTRVGGTASSDVASIWALCGAAPMLAVHRFSRRVGTGWTGLALSLVGAGAVLVAAWLLMIPPRAQLDTVERLPVLLTAGNALLMAGGLSFVLYSMLFVAEDAQLSHVSWLGLGLVLGTCALAVLFAFPNGPGTGMYLPLSAPDGVPAEVRVGLDEGGTLRFVATPLVLVSTGETLGTLLLALAVVCIVAGGVASFSRELGRIGFGLVAVLSIAGMVYVYGLVGPQGMPSPEEQLATMRAAGVAPDLIVQGPLVSHAEVVLHPSTLAPVLFVLWVLVAVAGWRAIAPVVTDEDSGHRSRVDGFVIGSSLSGSRDAALMATVLLWLGLSVGLFATFELTGRYVVGHGVSGFFALGALALATVTGWHSALGRGSRAAFGTWVVMPTVTLIIAAWVILSGLFGSAAMTFVSVIP